MRKILRAFRISPISAMEIEAGIVPVSIRFEKICKNYALRILQMQSSHSVKMKAPANSPFNQLNGINLTELNLNSANSANIANWNQQHSEYESESEPEFHSQRQRKKKVKIKKQKKHFSQLFRLCSYLTDIVDSDDKIESFDSSFNFPWKKSTILTEIDSNDKNIAASNHREKIVKLQQNHHENIIIYSDDFKLSEKKIDAGSFISYSLYK